MGETWKEGGGRERMLKVGKGNREGGGVAGVIVGNKGVRGNCEMLSILRLARKAQVFCNP